jgi:hypothetical protein
MKLVKPDFYTMHVAVEAPTVDLSGDGESVGRMFAVEGGKADHCEVGEHAPHGEGHEGVPWGVDQIVCVVS